MSEGVLERAASAQHFRVVPTTCFETFPLPWPPGAEPADDPRVAAIAAAAKELNDLRERWLNPPEWTREEILEFPGAVGGPWTKYIQQQPSTNAHESTRIGKNGNDGFTMKDMKDGEAGKSQDDVPGRASPPVIGLVRYPRLVPRDDACAAKLKRRTLTNLYNERPTWLALAHARLDAAVFAAYGWPGDVDDEGVLERLLALNLERTNGKA